MVFFRVKKIKGNDYAYLVENEWKRKSSKQKVKGYLGRGFKFNLVNDDSFSSFKKIGNMENYVKEKKQNEIIFDLIEWELFKNGVNKEEFQVDLSSHKVQKNKKDVVLLINDGFMCGLTLKNLFNFKPSGDEQDDGFLLARAFVETGIKIPQEIFIGLFGKLYIRQEGQF